MVRILMPNLLPIPCFLRGNRYLPKSKKGRGSQSWCRKGLNSLFTFAGNPFKTSCMYAYSVLFLINSSRLSNSHSDENFCSFPYQECFMTAALGELKGRYMFHWKEYGAPLYTDSCVFVVNFEQISYLIFKNILKYLIKLEHAYANGKFMAKQYHS